MKTKFANGQPIVTGDRVQLQQASLTSFSVLQAMGADSEGHREVLITTSQTELNNLCTGVQDTGPGLSLEALSRSMNHSTRQSPTAWEWDWQSAARLWKPTADACGSLLASRVGLSFSL